MRDLPINRVMTPNPATVAPDDSVATARALLATDGMHHLPVVANEKLVGIVSSADFLKLYLLDAGGGESGAAKVRHIMEKDPVVLDTGANLRDAAMRLSAGGFHALPVVDAERRLEGIVTSGDLLEFVVRQIPRGDGSLDTSRPEQALPPVADDQVRELVRTAEKELASTPEDDPVQRALVFLYRQNRSLDAACHAAELYIRSGHGGHEHSVLLQRLAALRKSDVLGL